MNHYTGGALIHLNGPAAPSPDLSSVSSVIRAIEQAELARAERARTCPTGFLQRPPWPLEASAPCPMLSPLPLTAR